MRGSHGPGRLKTGRCESDSQLSFYTLCFNSNNGRRGREEDEGLKPQDCEDLLCSGASETTGRVSFHAGGVGNSASVCVCVVTADCRQERDSSVLFP